MNDDLEFVFLTEKDKEIILDNPLLLTSLWETTQQAILIKAWPSIMEAQVLKAQAGDTTSAKFITEFIEAIAQTKASGISTPVEWELSAMILRDRLGAEISAEVLVQLVLDYYLNCDINLLRQLLKL